MISFLSVIHIIICILLIISILLQASKGGGLAGVLGGGGSSLGGVFGGRGAASFLSKVTMWLGILFALSSISIALLSTGKSAKPKSLIQQVQENTVSPSSMLPTVPDKETALPKEASPQNPSK